MDDGIEWVSDRLHARSSILKQSQIGPTPTLVPSLYGVVRGCNRALVLTACRPSTGVATRVLGSRVVNPLLAGNAWHIDVTDASDVAVAAADAASDAALAASDAAAIH